MYNAIPNPTLGRLSNLLTPPRPFVRSEPHIKPSSISKPTCRPDNCWNHPPTIRAPLPTQRGMELRVRLRFAGFSTVPALTSGNRTTDKISDTSPHHQRLLKGLHDFFAVRWRVKKESIHRKLYSEYLHQQDILDGNVLDLFR